jgi:DNA polymerase III subunit alpha
MFPGNSKIIAYFKGSGKKAVSHCLIHEALIKELKEILGAENVVLKTGGNT